MKDTLKVKIYPADFAGFPNYYAINGVEVDRELLEINEAEALKPFGFNDRKSSEFKPCSGYAGEPYDKAKVGNHKIQLDVESHEWLYVEYNKHPLPPL